MEYGKIKELIEFCNDLNINVRETYDSIVEGEQDFRIELNRKNGVHTEYNEYRFISKDAIDDIYEAELEDDAYILGSYNSWYIADRTNLTTDIIDALQKHGEYEVIGDYIINHGHLRDFCENYGEHFSSYDGNEMEVLNFYCFRTN